MPVLLRHLVESPRACSYLPARLARLEHRLLLEVSPSDLEHLLSRGWRRFGPVYFRPACDACGECVTLRIPVASFAPSTSQRRVVRRASALRVSLAVPTVDDERLALYASWHGDREEARGWPGNPVDADSYAMDLAFPHPAARELTFRDDAAGGRLVGVGLWDDMPHALSAVYFYFDPAYAAWSLGTANILVRIAEARTRGLDHVYLGYRVEACPSLAYKARFRPHELLVGRPALDAEPEWIEAPGPARGAS